ncbi:nicotinate-nucleotide--dimethylbenzimidazole phosphoribosyltransferase [uncultured Pseudoteredinibacter sp.]|uniref:nicotinate-nucleotide--dimethylbenzimidazole phosphoribosyltransferase n=1 Tax=uncultured Pseudoteredinibacter sp. TaxID=1641701 RepID=UPI0026105D07|nr:nicotinate-nucleotide--dimethylbenzimidazole phosphoribosyltransferase [uncultured Pseudoteredinibacter sp.]
MPETQYWFDQDITLPSNDKREEAVQHQLQLTKPAGSLSKLETLAIELAAQQNNNKPTIQAPQITVFAADHGIAQQGVSAFPQSVTAQMVSNFIAGGAAISVLARQFDAQMEVVNLGTCHPIPQHTARGQKPAQRLHNAVIAKSTADFSRQAAMSNQQAQQALQEGANALDRAPLECSLFIGGEMGIANTSSAAALAAVLLNKDVSEVCGYGTGISEEARSQKAKLINAGVLRFTEKAKTQNLNERQRALLALEELGGFEIAALCGAYIRAAQMGKSILLDGVISSVAALLACKINPAVMHYLLASHLSAEVAHKPILDSLSLTPLLEWNMRLGEGSGAALCIGLLESACQIHNNMATFAEAGVSQ